MLLFSGEKVPAAAGADARQPRGSPMQAGKQRERAPAVEVDDALVGGGEAEALAVLVAEARA